MVNLDSDLFREHPEYAVSIPGRQPSFGRHQLVLDLTNAQVRDYIVDHICDLLDNTDIRYPPWVHMYRHRPVSKPYVRRVWQIVFIGCRVALKAMQQMAVSSWLGSCSIMLLMALVIARTFA